MNPVLVLLILIGAGLLWFLLSFSFGMNTQGDKSSSGQYPFWYLLLFLQRLIGTVKRRLNGFFIIVPLVYHKRLITLFSGRASALSGMCISPRNQPILWRLRGVLCTAPPRYLYRHYRGYRWKLCLLPKQQSQAHPSYIFQNDKYCCMC